MSYDINLLDPVTRETVKFDNAHMMRGGTFVFGGTNEAWLNVTWNYGRWYNLDGVFPDMGENRRGIRSIYDLTGVESIPVLKRAISVLESLDGDISNEERRDHEESGATGYWMPTRANAIKPLYQLLAFAEMRPDGVWKGD